MIEKSEDIINAHEVTFVIRYYGLCCTLKNQLQSIKSGGNFGGRDICF